MEEKSIKILNEQIAKLDNKDFDLEAWKSSSTAMLARIFGKDDYRIKQILDLKIDYSSWALRDASSSYNPKKSCKKIGREILETSINELRTFGEQPESAPKNTPVLIALEEEFTGAQMKQLKGTLNSTQSLAEKRKLILKPLNSLSKEKAMAILATLLLVGDESI